MKTSFLKMFTLVSYILILSTLVISCTENDTTITPTQSSTQNLRTAIQSITSPNSMTTNPNNLNHSSDFLDDFECFDLVFPLDVTDGVTTTTINSYDELFAYYDALPANADPNFVFPITIESDDGTQESIPDFQALEEEFIECIDDAEECFTLNFPLTVTDGNGNNTDVANENELFDFYDSLNDDDEPNFIYPISVTLTEDGSVVTINNDEEFDTLYEDCYDFEDCGDFEESACFSLQYPIAATSAAGGVAINSDDDLEDYFDNLGDDEDPQFTFPITIVFDDGTEQMVNNLEELEDEFDACYDDEIDIDDCFTFNYPITLVKDDGSTSTVNSDDEFETFIDDLGNDEDFNFQYPFNVTLLDGTVQTVNNEDAFYQLFDDCE